MGTLDAPRRSSSGRRSPAAADSAGTDETLQEKQDPRTQGTPVEVVLRMMLLKHVRNWSFEVLSREVRANLVYRDFTRIGAEKVPDEKTMGNLARQLSPELFDKLHQRMVGIALENKIVTGQKMRVDTT